MIVHKARPKMVGALDASDAPPRRLVPGILGVLAVIVSAVLLRQARGIPVGPDAGWQSLMASHQRVPAFAIAQALAFVGSSSGALLVTGAVVIIQLCLRRWHAAIALPITVSLGAVGSTSLKLVSERPSPGGTLDLTTFSFPSGHTTWAAAFAVALALGLPRVWTMFAAAGWTAFMAWGRTYLDVHWLSDVAAGALLGISLALIVDGMLTRLSAQFRWLRPREGLGRAVVVPDKE